MATVNEVVTDFKFVGNTNKLTAYNKELQSSIKLLAGFATAVVGAASAFGVFVAKTTAGIDPLIQISRTTKVSIEALQELGFAASQMGSDLNAVQGSVLNLSKKIGEAAQRGSEDFARLGISVRDNFGHIKSADKILLELNKRFRQLNLSSSEQQDFAERLGIDRSLVQLLGSTSKEIAKLRLQARDIGIFDQKSADAAVSFNDSLTRLRFSLGAVRNSIALGFAPTLENLADKFTAFIADNKDTINSVFTTLSKSLVAFSSTIVRLLPAMGLMTGAFVALKIAALGFSGALALALSPVVLITAGIAATLLIVDDLIVAFNGGKSVIAGFFKEFLGVDIRPILQGIVKVTKLLISGFIDFGKFAIKTFATVGKAIGKLFTGDIKGFFDGINNAIFMVLDRIVQMSKMLGKLLITPLKGLFNLFKKDNEINVTPKLNMPKETNMVAALVNQKANGAGSNDLNNFVTNTSSPTNSNTNSTNNEVNQTIEINVNGSDAPIQTARTIADNLQLQLDDAQSQFKVGGM